MKSGLILSALTQAPPDNDEGRAAIDGQRAERHDDRRNVELPDQHAVDGAEHQRRRRARRGSAAAIGIAGIARR